MDRRGKILKEAMKCIHRIGAERTNAKLIAKRLKIPTSSVFYYFPKHTDIFTECVLEVIRINHDMVARQFQSASTQTAREIMSSYLEGNMLWSSKFPEHVAIMIFGLLNSSSSKSIAVLMRAAMEGGRQRIVSIIEKGVVEGSFSKPANILMTAAAVQNLIAASVQEIYLEHATDSLANQIESLKHHVFLILK